MASIYERGDFYWIKYRNPATGRVERESTKIRIASANGRTASENRRAAMKIANDHSKRELEAPRHSGSEAWLAWVPAYIEHRYAHSPTTRLRVQNAWAALHAYLQARKIHYPRGLSYAMVAAYLPWRLGKEGPLAGLRTVSHNTAVLEVKFLAVIMREAVRREFASANPCREVELRRINTKQKEEITGDQQAKIEAELSKPETPQWMREHWLVLMKQGCRCAEAAVPLDRVNEESMTITLRLKGGVLFTAPLHVDLLPLVARARREKRKTLVELPQPGHEGPSGVPKLWHNLFHKVLKLPLSIHCTRVTVITRLLRAGYTPAEVCAYVGHTEEVNVIYRRLRPSDVRRLGSALDATPSPAPNNVGLRIVA